MADWRRIFGTNAESFAARYLKKKGYRILEHQFTTRFGEIDLIAKDGDEIVFVEVKARQSIQFGYPEEAVTKKKLEKIMRVGEQYLADRNMSESPFRVDVIAIIQDTSSNEINHIIGVGA